MQDMHLNGQTARHKVVGHENAKHELAADLTDHAAIKKGLRTSVFSVPFDCLSQFIAKNSGQQQHRDS